MRFSIEDLEQKSGKLFRAISAFKPLLCDVYISDFYFLHVYINGLISFRMSFTAVSSRLQDENNNMTIYLVGI